MTQRDHLEKMFKRFLDDEDMSFNGSDSPMQSMKQLRLLSSYAWRYIGVARIKQSRLPEAIEHDAAIVLDIAICEFVRCFRENGTYYRVENLARAWFDHKNNPDIQSLDLLEYSLLSFDSALDIL